MKLSEAFVFELMDASLFILLINAAPAFVDVETTSGKFTDEAIPGVCEGPAEDVAAGVAIGVVAGEIIGVDAVLV